MTGRIQLSVVIPVFNEEQGIDALCDRLYPALDALESSYEVIFVDDGSRDESPRKLARQFETRPDVTRVILLAVNAGQHMAILAGFERSRGDVVVTLDADLQNPPEEIGRLLEQIRLGHDYVGSYRRARQDTWFRRKASALLNTIRDRTTHISMKDQGCMLRAYSRSVVDAVNRSREVNTFVPALAYLFSHNPTEIEVAHEERAVGESKYSLYSLLRLNFDLMTGFSLIPLQLFSLFGIAISAGSLLFVVFLAIRRLIVGPEAEGVFTLFGILFFLIGVALFGLGVLGEYVGRIYQEARARPRYLVQAVLEAPEAEAAFELERRSRVEPPLETRVDEIA